MIIVVTLECKIKDKYHISRIINTYHYDIRQNIRMPVGDVFGSCIFRST